MNKKQLKNMNTLDILIKQLDEYALMDIMEIIHQYELTYSFDRNEQINQDNDFTFQYIMKKIIEKNNTLSEAMRPLVNEYSNMISDYAADICNKNQSMYDKLITKCDEIQYIK